MITPTFTNYNTYVKRNNFQTNPQFKGGFRPETLTHTNIGSCMNGYIGKVKVRNGDGGESFLNVFKHLSCEGEEYKIMNDFNNLIGYAKIKIQKYENHYGYGCKEDPSHVFVSELRNFSKPGTPYHNKDLSYYKDIGTRFLQIAQRRSDEAQCSGNIKLIAKNESKPFYMNVIHMKEEFPMGSPLRRFNNPNTMYLPPEAKEPLSRLQGGL